MWKAAFTLIAALTIGNFLYQAFANQEWETAFERSWFQAVAIVLFVYYWTHQ